MFLIQDDNFKINNAGKRVRRMTRVEANRLKQSVESALNNPPNGKKYIKDLIETVAKNTKGEIISTEIPYLFERVYESRATNPIYGGIWIFMESSIGSFGVNQWDWVGGRGSADIYMHFSNEMPKGTEKLSETDQIAPRNQSIQLYLNSPERGGMPTIHELMHVAIKGRVPIGKVTESAGVDSHYAYAAADLAGEKRPVYISAAAVICQKFTTLEALNKALPSHIIVTRNREEAASAYWGQRLLQACGYKSHITNEPTYFKLYK